MFIFKYREESSWVQLPFIKMTTNSAELEELLIVFEKFLVATEVEIPKGMELGLVPIVDIREAIGRAEAELEEEEEEKSIAGYFND
jgi:hypothetical protein